MMRQKLALVVKLSLSVGLSLMKGFSPVTITTLGSAVLIGLASIQFQQRLASGADQGNRDAAARHRGADLQIASLVPVNPASTAGGCMAQALLRPWLAGSRASR